MEETTTQQPKKKSGFVKYGITIFSCVFGYFLYTQYNKNVEEAEAAKADTTVVVVAPVADTTASVVDTTVKVVDTTKVK